MPDLGKYAGTVLAAYGVALTLLLGLIALTLWRSRQARRALSQQEKAGRSDG